MYWRPVAGARRVAQSAGIQHAGGVVVVPGEAAAARQIPARAFECAIGEAHVAADAGLVGDGVVAAVDAGVSPAAGDAEAEERAHPVVHADECAVDAGAVAARAGDGVLLQAGAEGVAPHPVVGEVRIERRHVPVGGVLVRRAEAHAAIGRSRHTQRVGWRRDVAGAEARWGTKACRARTRGAHAEQALVDVLAGQEGQGDRGLLGGEVGLRR